MTIIITITIEKKNIKINTSIRHVKNRKLLLSFCASLTNSRLPLACPGFGVIVYLDNYPLNVILKYYLLTIFYNN